MVVHRVLVSVLLVAAVGLAAPAIADVYDYDNPPLLCDGLAAASTSTTVRAGGPADHALWGVDVSAGYAYDSSLNFFATNTARSGTQLVDDSLQGLSSGRSSGVRVVDSVDELDDLFGQLSVDGTPVSGTTYPGKIVELPDGTTVGIRATSVSGGPTIDIKLPNGTRMKVHVNQ